SSEGGKAASRWNSSLTSIVCPAPASGFGTLIAHVFTPADKSGYASGPFSSGDELTVDEPPGRGLAVVGGVVLAQHDGPATLAGLAAQVERHQPQQGVEAG